MTLRHCRDGLDGLDALVLAESERVFKVTHSELTLCVVVDRSRPDGRTFAQVLHLDLVFEVVHVAPRSLQHFVFNRLINGFYVVDA